MKKLSLALVAALSLSTAVFAQESGGIPGANGQIKFTGTITEKGCTIVAGNSAIVNLGAMPKAALKNSKGAWGESQLKFVDCNLELKEGAKKLESVQLTINPGFNASFSDDLWANNGTAEGVGVEVEIADEGGMKPVTPAGITEPLVANIDPVNDSATYQVRGRMVGNENVTAGSVESIISFVASYK